MSHQSDSTKLLAIGLLNLADDEGYFYADPRMVRNALRPMDDDSRIVTVSLRELSQIGYIEVRKHETHGDVGLVKSFRDHQVINKGKKSKIKEFYEYGIDTVLIPSDYHAERKGMEGNGKEGLLSDESDETETIWKAFPQMSRKRSSKAAVGKAWKKTKDRPSLQSVLASLEVWKKDEKWTKDGGQYQEGAHIWIQGRQWENDAVIGNPSQQPSQTTYTGPDGCIYKMVQ